MRVCLLSVSYPPSSTEGIARQRQALATELARLGHDVHVITCGGRSRTWNDDGALIHEVAVTRLLHYSSTYPELDEMLTYSQALYEELATLAMQQPFDVVDTPLWLAQGFVTHQRYVSPTVLWLQTTSAQLLVINRQRPTKADRGRLDLERICMERAHGLLGDSHSALDAIVQDYRVRPSVPTKVVYLGLPPLREGTPRRAAPHQGVEVLVVGRLEQRKGTRLLFTLLPQLLQRMPKLTVRFVGRDNSENDGWKAQHGLTYPEYFARHYPHLTERVLFEGYVTETQLSEFYRRSDIFLAPSLYESFGLHFLEAMRVALPVVTFATGGAAEIFQVGEDSGALLVPPGESQRLAEALVRLVDDPNLRKRVGESGLAHFQKSFTAEAMARGTLQFYEQVVAAYVARANTARPIYQVMEAMDEGDAVSQIAYRNASILGELGQPDVVLARSAPNSIRKNTAPLEHALATPHCGIIFHYWGFSSATWMINTFSGPKALYYHNITPPEFFPTNSAIHQHLTKGYVQLSQIVNHFDILIGDSRYNLSQLVPLLSRSRPSLAIYPVMERDDMRQSPYDRRLLKQLQSTGDVNFLFVGRVAANKRFDQIMHVFDLFAREINPRSRLWLVGNDNFDPAYRAELELLRSQLKTGSHITFTGKVSDESLHSYFRAADIFICASEHEGFCVPVAQAMTIDLPVVALAAAALPETLGPSPGLVETWEPVAVAQLLDRILRETSIRQDILSVQGESLTRFTLTAARERLQALIQFLLNDVQSPLFETVPTTA